MKKNDYSKEFIQTITLLTRRYDRHRVFDDFLTMGICAYHSTNIKSNCQEKDEQNEALYFQTIDKYKQQELETFSKLLAVLQRSIYHTPFGDLLGEYFTLHIANGENGQYFTPEHICQLMTKINSPKNRRDDVFSILPVGQDAFYLVLPKKTLTIISLEQMSVALVQKNDNTQFLFKWT